MTWIDDLNYGLAAFGVKIPGRVTLDQWAPKLADAPMRNAAALVATTAAAFLAVEKNHNPKVRDLYDATLYCSTCLSVGYSEIQPLTPAGKLIGSLLMMVGPALANRALDGQADGPVAGRKDVVQEQILLTLQKMLAKMEENEGAKPDAGV